jgi:hypothetical protein
MRQWPPNWSLTYGPGRTAVSGEIGVLEAVFLSQVIINKVLLLMHTAEDNTYIGSLMFESADSAKAVFDLLYARINKPLTAIGDLDLPESFGK